MLCVRCEKTMDQNAGWNAFVEVLFEKVLPWALTSLLGFGCFFIWQSNAIQATIQVRLDNIARTEQQVSETLKALQQGTLRTMQEDINKLKIDVAVLKK